MDKRPQKLIESRPTPHIPAALAERGGVAELAASLIMGFFRAHAIAHQIGGSFLNVVLHFLRHLLIQSVAAKPLHDGSHDSDGLITLAIPANIRSNCEIS